MERDEQFFKRLFMSAPIGIYIVQGGKFQFVNPQFERITGYCEEELIGIEAMGFVLPEYRDYVKASAIKMLKEGHFLPYEYCILKRDGQRRWIMETVASIRYLRGRATLGYFMDITERKELEEALRRSEEQYKTAIEHSNDGVAILLKGEFLFVNSKFIEIFGYDNKDELIGRPGNIVIHPDDRKRVKDIDRKTKEGKEVPSIYEFKGIRKDGQVIWIEVSRTRTTYRGEDVSLAYFRDISERKKMEEALLENERRYRELSIKDHLTDLFNLRHFMDQIRIEAERSRRYSHPLSLLLLDIDDFKKFNDQYGHLEGDKVLIRLADILKRSLRKVDSAYRYGGEEFMVLLPETDGQRAMVAAERIRKEFENEEFYPISGVIVKKTISIGVTEYRPNEELSSFIKRADIAMYFAKRGGKNRVFLLN